ncbi:MAG: DUF6020 family protein [Flavobacteriales bacterium]|nr:DUF6020 family protein [Flavobacteriales bacterium]
MKQIPDWILSLALLALAFGVRILNINETDISGDEPFSLYVAQFDIVTIIRYLSSGNNPPLYEILLHYYVFYFGNNDLTVRLFPSILNALTVIPIFLTGLRFFNKRIALIAAGMFIFSTYHIRFSHEIRVYSLFSLFTAWALFYFLSTLSRPSEKLNWVGLVVCNIILLYSHFTAFYVLLVESILGLIVFRHEYWKRYLVSLMVVCVCYSPYLFTFLTRLTDVQNAGTWVSKPGIGEIYGGINLMLNQRLNTVSISMSIVLGMALTPKLFWSQQLNKAFFDRSGVSLAIWFCVPYLLMFLCSIYYIPMFIDRYVLYITIPLFLLVAWMIDLVYELSKMKWLGGLLIVIGSIATVNFNPPNNRQIKAAVDYVATWRDDNTNVYICPDLFDLAFAYHFNREWFYHNQPFEQSNPISTLDSILVANRIYPVRDSTQIVNSNGQRTIYLDADSKFVFPSNNLLQTFERQFELKDSTHFHQIFDVYVFEKNTSTH